jgi:hypothetical protein
MKRPKAPGLLAGQICLIQADHALFFLAGPDEQYIGFSFFPGGLSPPVHHSLSQGTSGCLSM